MEPQGVVAKISCEAKAEYGYKVAKFSILTPKTDKNGYYLATFTAEQLGDGLKPTNCKVYLESSPSYTCNVDTNVHLGVIGAPLTYSQHIADYEKQYNLELYSIPLFAYKSSAKCEYYPSYYKKPVYTPKCTPSTYTPKGSYEAPSYVSPTYSPKPNYKTPTYTPGSDYKALESPTYTQESYVPTYETPSYNLESSYETPPHIPKSSYETPSYYTPKSSYVPASENKALAYDNYGY